MLIQQTVCHVKSLRASYLATLTISVVSIWFIICSYDFSMDYLVMNCLEHVTSHTCPSKT